MRGFCDRVVEEAHEDRVGQDAGVVIFSTPDRVSMQYAPRLYEAGIGVLDYSGDFRFKELAVYAAYAKRQPSVAGKPHECPELLGKSAYGVSGDRLAGPFASRVAAALARLRGPVHKAGSRSSARCADIN